jgi:4-hydroxybenzoate polyprenyltransferase
MLAFALVSAAGFVAVAATFNIWCLALSPVVLAVVFGYSLTKRFTAMAHLCVGLALALSPPAAYLAARGAIAWDVVVVLWLSLAVLCWVAGFDIIYACQDVSHDRREGLHSIPARWGVPAALWAARGLHVVMLIALTRTVSLGGLGTLSWVAIGMMAVLLVIEHLLVAGGDLSRVNAAFFTVNGIVGVIFGVFVGADLLWP